MAESAKRAAARAAAAQAAAARWAELVAGCQGCAARHTQAMHKALLNCGGAALSAFSAKPPQAPPPPPPLAGAANANANAHAAGAPNALARCLGGLRAAPGRSGEGEG